MRIWAFWGDITVPIIESLTEQETWTVRVIQHNRRANAKVWGIGRVFKVGSEECGHVVSLGSVP